MTGASIDVPPSNPMEENGGGDNKGGGNQEEEEVLVTIEGPFFAIQVFTCCLHNLFRSKVLLIQVGLHSRGSK